MDDQANEVYIVALADLSDEQFQRATMRAIRELKFFPRPSELRELSGIGNPKEQLDAEAHAAFQAVITSLERRGVDAGIPHLPDRTQFAVRQCGGLYQFNTRLQVQYGDDENPGHVESRSAIFLQKEFIEAYRAYDVHKAILPQLTEKGLLALPQPVRAFLRSENRPPTAKPAKPETQEKAKAQAFAARSSRVVTEA
jgi:hypothetical protein